MTDAYGADLRESRNSDASLQVFGASHRRTFT